LKSGRKLIRKSVIVEKLKTPDLKTGRIFGQRLAKLGCAAERLCIAAGLVKVISHNQSVDVPARFFLTGRKITTTHESDEKKKCSVHNISSKYHQ
jgi:hypothetical protein